MAADIIGVVPFESFYRGRGGWATPQADDNPDNVALAFGRVRMSYPVYNERYKVRGSSCQLALLFEGERRRSP